MEQQIVFGTLLTALILFIWGKIRHDIVAIVCLLILVISGIIKPENAFLGFAHPAVITVAMVLIVSAGLQHSGLIDLIGANLLKVGKNMIMQITMLCFLTALFSAFMNNVGALAILMPVAIHIARKSGHSPSKYLMPLAFASLFGGMTTLIGTPPNIIISSFREKALGVPYQMFDFANVGLPLTVIALLFISFIGWRLIPKRKSESEENNTFQINEYLTEVRVIEDSKLIGENILSINTLTSVPVSVIGLIRNNRIIHAPGEKEVFRVDDVLIIDADSDNMKEFIENTRSKLFARQELEKNVEGESELTMIEAVVMSNSELVNQTAVSIQLRTRFKVNLLAIARQGTKMLQRIDHTKFQSGDVLLMHGYKNNLSETLLDLDCLPLADRGFDINKPKRVFTALAIFVAAIALVMTGVLKVQIAFSLAALFMILFKIIPLKNLYTSIDWPVIVLLGAMLPLGDALETTGGATLVANKIVSIGINYPMWVTLAIFLITTMTLSDIINNAATVVLMAPIGIQIATGMHVSPDIFLMTTAIGASCAFLTPIGHQSNTLVMGPGGYKFFDYTRMGLPLEILTGIVALLLILHFWV